MADYPGKRVIVKIVKNTQQHISDLPTHFPVAVIMQRSPCLFTVWCDYLWQAIGIAVIQDRTDDPGQAQLVHEDGDTSHYLYAGFNVRLYVDECESYYHNLMSPKPRGYVVARIGENDAPVPFLVSMSFDEAHAYLEGDEEVYDVDIPAELYRWTETFVLAHYTPEKRVKRKRQDWKQSK